MNFIKEHWFEILLIALAALSYKFIDWSKISIFNYIKLP